MESKARQTDKPTEDNMKLIGIEFYHRYKDDIKLFAEMGFKVFRPLSQDKGIVPFKIAIIAAFFILRNQILVPSSRSQRNRKLDLA